MVNLVFLRLKNGETVHTTMSTTEVFLIAMMLIFTIPYLIWRVGKTEYYAPLVVIQIITGILLGPGILGGGLSGLLRLCFQSTGDPVVEWYRLVGGDGFYLDRRYRTGSAKSLGTSPGKRYHHPGWHWERR
jgi:hypothetical protein